jgi:hypothetical protein
VAASVLLVGDSALTLVLDGSTWDGGLTANLKLTNSGTVPLADWSLSFESDVQISGSPWGLSVSVSKLSNGHYAYTLTGMDWGAALAPGASVTVGFNATQSSTRTRGILRPATLFVTNPVASVLLTAPSAPMLSTTPAVSLVVAAPAAGPLPSGSAEANPTSLAVKGGGQNYAEAL